LSKGAVVVVVARHHHHGPKKRVPPTKQDLFFWVEWMLNFEIQDVEF
jgi:hypothetical protein